MLNLNSIFGRAVEPINVEPTNFNPDVAQKETAPSQKPSVKRLVDEQGLSLKEARAVYDKWRNTDPARKAMKLESKRRLAQDARQKSKDGVPLRGEDVIGSFICYLKTSELSGQVVDYVLGRAARIVDGVVTIECIRRDRDQLTEEIPLKALRPEHLFLSKLSAQAAAGHAAKRIKKLKAVRAMKRADLFESVKPASVATVKKKLHIPLEDEKPAVDRNEADFRYFKKYHPLLNIVRLAGTRDLLSYCRGAILSGLITKEEIKEVYREYGGSRSDQISREAIPLAMFDLAELVDANRSKPKAPPAPVLTDRQKDILAVVAKLPTWAWTAGPDIRPKTAAINALCPQLQILSHELKEIKAHWLPMVPKKEGAQ